MQTRTKKLTVLAMMAALAYLIMVVGRVPVVLFLKYDPKDVIITISGFLYGPLSALAVSFVVSFVEMLTVSDTGPIGLVMNIIATCSFSCTAAAIYKRIHTMKGAVIGLSAGWVMATCVMLLWNYFLTPIYMGVPREVVAGMLLPALLPFNLLKGGLNAALTLIIYKPVRRALTKSGLMPYTDEKAAGGKANIGVIIVSVFIILTCVIAILVFQKKI